MAISTSLTWTVLNVDRDLSDGFIYNANYKITGICTETISGVSTTYGPVETEGTTNFSTARTGSEIPYDDVTEDNVVTWIKTSPQMNATTVIGKDQPDPITTTELKDKEKSVYDHLNVIRRQATPTTGSGTPW